MISQENTDIIWTDYFRYRAEVRGYDLSEIEAILRYSDERYYDTEILRLAVVGRHDERLVIIPYETGNMSITPVTIHAITRQQIRFRIKIGRLIYEQT